MSTGKIMNDRTLYSCLKPFKSKEGAGYLLKDNSLSNTELDPVIAWKVRLEKFGKNDYAVILEGWDDEAYYLQFDDERYDNKEGALRKFLSILSMESITRDYVKNNKFYPW